MNRGESSRENMQTTGRYSCYILSSKRGKLVYNKSTFSSNPVVELLLESPHGLFFTAQPHVRAYELCLFWQAEKYKLFSAQKYSLSSSDRYLYKLSKHRLCTCSAPVFLSILSKLNVPSETQIFGEIEWI